MAGVSGGARGLKNNNNNNNLKKYMKIFNNIANKI